MTRKHSAVRSAVPPRRAAERGTARSTPGTEHRNDTGTLALEALIDRVLSRTRSGTPSGTEAERTIENAVPPPRNATCPHIDNPVLAEWYANHPQVVCARCWLDGHPTRGGRHD